MRRRVNAKSEQLGRISTLSRDDIDVLTFRVDRDFAGRDRQRLIRSDGSQSAAAGGHRKRDHVRTPDARTRSVESCAARIGCESHVSGQAGQLRRLLRCVCRHALTLANVTVQGLCSLPSGWNFTLLVSQPELGPDSVRVLRAARNRGSHILRGGRLHHLYVPVATFAQTYPNLDGSLVSLEIPVIPTPAPLSLLNDSSERKIADEFQGRLLGYLLDNASKVETSRENIVGLNYSMLELAQALAATTPDDAGLQKEIIDIVKAQDTAMRPMRLGGIEGAIIEAILFHCHESQKDRIYIGEITEVAQEILTRRGEGMVLTARGVGEKLRQLQFLVEPRDSRGFFLMLNQKNSGRAHELGRVFDVSTFQDGVSRCDLCRAGTRPEESGRRERN